MTDPKSLTDEEIKAISRMDCTFSVHTVRRLLATIAARDAEIERLTDEISSYRVRSQYRQRFAND